MSLQIQNRENIMQLLARNEIDLVIMGTHLAAKRLSPAAREFKSFLIAEAGPLIKLWA